MPETPGWLNRTVPPQSEGRTRLLVDADEDFEVTRIRHPMASDGLRVAAASMVAADREARMRIQQALAPFAFGVALVRLQSGAQWVAAIKWLAVLLALLGSRSAAPPSSSAA